MSITPQERIAAQEAGRHGRPNPVKRDDESTEGEQLFHLWHVALVESETGLKILGGKSADYTDPDLRVCRAKATKLKDEEL